MKPWEEYDQYLSLIHHESLPEDANDYSDYYLNENPDGYYEVDGALYNDAEHYEFSKNNKEILEYNQKRKYEDKLKANQEKMKATAYDEGLREQYLKNHDVEGFCRSYENECEKFKEKVAERMKAAAE